MRYRYTVYIFFQVKTIYRTVEEVIREGGAPLRAVKGGGGVKVSIRRFCPVICAD